MKFSWAKDFEEALADPNVLEERLETLAKERKRASGVATFTFVVFFISIFASLLTYYRCQQLGIPSIIAPLMLFGGLQQLLAVASSQNEIRILLAFKKLRELQSPD